MICGETMNSKFYPKLLALCVSSAISSGVNADIFISQYVEGGSYNKAVEIANTGSSQIDLTGYKLANSYNGSGNWDNKLSLDGLSIAANQVIVIANTRASDAIKALAVKQDSSVVNHNGDDPLAILDASDQVVDMIGVMGDVDWGKDITLVRNSNGQAASSTYNNKHWNSLAKDDITGLGQLDVPAAPEPFNCQVDGNSPTFTNIEAIQGSGERSPLLADGTYIGTDDVYVQGIVSAVTTGLTKGFYLHAQTPDNDPATSDGLFISTGEGTSELKAGDVVCVKGKVQEYYNNTQLASNGDSYIKTGTAEVPHGAKFVVNEGETLRQALERYEGMLLELDADSKLFVTRNFSYDYDSKRNNMLLSYKAPLFKPTQLYAAESAQAVALADQNRNSRVFLESDAKAPSGKIPYYPDFAKDIDQDGSSEYHIRLGSRLEGLKAVVNYSFNEYRLIATNELTNSNFVTSGKGFDVSRTSAPSIAKSDLRVASFNVLNYFTSVAASGDANPTGQNRGATKNEEFLIQQAKIVAAMTKMDADIIGLMEVENNGFGDGSAIKSLTDALNAKIANTEDHYSFVEIAKADKHQDAYFGTDAIMVAILYRASEVTPKQAAQVIVTPEQHVAESTVTRSDGNGGTETNNPAYDKYQRHSLLQTFTLKETGDDLSIVVNHFKSKGSNCIEEWIDRADREPTDLQGNCNRFRVSAAKAVGEALKNLQGDVLVMGDMNAYGLEDPLLVLTDYSQEKYGREVFTAGYTTLGKNADGSNATYEQTGSKIIQGYGYINLATALHGTHTYSYTYGGELGNLDHALANSSLANKVVAIEDWHINSAETNMFEYSSKYTADMPKYNDAYSASDHDPVVIAIDLPDKKIELPTNGEKLTVNVTLPFSAKVDDVVTVTLTQESSVAASRSAALTQAGATYSASAKVTQTDLDKRSVAVKFDKTPTAGSYKVEQKLNDTVLYTGNVTIAESSASSTTNTDGGSVGLGFLMFLSGLTMWRRRK